MFEKIKEYQFYILLGLAWAAALVYFILHTQTMKEWTNLLSTVQNSIINSVSKSDTYKKKFTIAKDIIDQLSGQSIGKYSIDTASGVLFMNNFNWDVDVANGSTTGDVPTSKSSTIYPIIYPASAIGQITDAWGNNDDLGWLVSNWYTDVSWNNEVSAENLTPAQKGYLVDLYFWFWTFANQNTAKSFKNSYLPNADFVKDSWGEYIVVQKISQK